MSPTFKKRIIFALLLASLMSPLGEAARYGRGGAGKTVRLPKAKKPRKPKMGRIY